MKKRLKRQKEENKLKKLKNKNRKGRKKNKNNKMKSKSLKRKLKWKELNYVLDIKTSIQLFFHLTQQSFGMKILSKRKDNLEVKVKLQFLKKMDQSIFITLMALYLSLEMENGLEFVEIKSLKVIGKVLFHMKKLFKEKLQ